MTGRPRLGSIIHIARTSGLAARLIKTAMGTPTWGLPSILGRVLGIGQSRVWYHLTGRVRMPADEFLGVMACLGCIAFVDDSLLLVIPVEKADADLIRALRAEVLAELGQPEGPPPA